MRELRGHCGGSEKRGQMERATWRAVIVRLTVRQLAICEWAGAATWRLLIARRRVGWLGVHNSAVRPPIEAPSSSTRSRQRALHLSLRNRTVILNDGTGDC